MSQFDFKPLPPCLSQKQRDYLWGNVDRRLSHECWLWLGDPSSSGYPRTWVKDVEYVGTRLAYLDYYGEQPGELCVCHTCDNRLCMNPHHFFLGDHDKNMADRQEKGRQYKGERHHLNKLREEQVIEILGLEGTMTTEAIGDRYGVSKSTIKAIFNGTNWSYLTGRRKKCKSSV